MMHNNDVMISRRRTLQTLALTPLWSGAATSVAAPAPASQLLQVVGERHKLLLRADGSVLGWGQAQDGQLGLPADATRGNAPVALPLPAPGVSVAAGARSSLVALEDGNVLAWGSGPLLGQASFGRPPVAAQRLSGLGGVVQLVAHGHTALARLDDGRVLAWGSGSDGEFGDGRSASYGLQNSSSPQWVPGVTGVVQISIGTGHVLALTSTGQVLSWGANAYGALGRGPRRERPLDEPGQVEGLSDVVQVAAGNGVSGAITRDGRVWVWGANWHGQFGNGTRTDPPGPDHGFELTPQPVAGISAAVALSLGLTGRHTLVRLRDGSLRGWGNTDWGQLGAGVKSSYQTRPVKVRLTDVVAVFAAGNSSFAERRDRSLWVWGAGGAGDWPLLANSAVPTALTLPG